MKFIPTPAPQSVLIAAAASSWIPLTAIVSQRHPGGLVLATVAFTLSLLGAAITGQREGAAPFRMLGGLFLGAAVFVIGAAVGGLEIRSAYPGSEWVSPWRLAGILVPVFSLLAGLTWIRTRGRGSALPSSES